MKNQIELLQQIASEEAIKISGFFDNNGPGVGNRMTLAYAGAVKKRMKEAKANFQDEYECQGTRLAVDYYFQECETIVEIALGLSRSNTEFEKDILKAIFIQKEHPVSKLVFICKPGGEKKCAQPGRMTIRKWVKEKYNIEMVVRDLK